MDGSREERILCRDSSENGISKFIKREYSPFKFSFLIHANKNNHNSQNRLQ